MAIGNYIGFLRIEFICIIWTLTLKSSVAFGSWGLNLFVLFERSQYKRYTGKVLEDWIYLYYLNASGLIFWIFPFLRIEFICIIWTIDSFWNDIHWFLRIEFICIIWTNLAVNYIDYRSWGLNLFVLFERLMAVNGTIVGSWGLNLFVLFELGNGNRLQKNCSSGLDNKKKYCYFLGVTLTTTYSHIPSVLIGKPQPTSLELMIFV